MRIDPLSQLITAVVSLLSGVGFGIIYDIFRTLRRRCKGTAIAVITDILFCLIVCTWIFILGYTLGGGQPRAYMAVFSALGAGIYFMLFSRPILCLLSLASDLIRRILEIIVLPLKLFAVSLKKLMFFLKNFFYYKKKWYTINWVSNVSSQENQKTNYRALRGNTNETEKGRYYY